VLLLLRIELPDLIVDSYRVYSWTSSCLKGSRLPNFSLDSLARLGDVWLRNPCGQLTDARHVIQLVDVRLSVVLGGEVGSGWYSMVVAHLLLRRIGTFLRGIRAVVLGYFVLGGVLLLPSIDAYITDHQVEHLTVCRNLLLQVDRGRPVALVCIVLHLCLVLNLWLLLEAVELVVLQDRLLNHGLVRFREKVVLFYVVLVRGHRFGQVSLQKLTLHALLLLNGQGGLWLVLLVVGAQQLLCSALLDGVRV